MGGHLSVTKYSYAKHNLAQGEEHGAEVVALRRVTQPFFSFLHNCVKIKARSRGRTLALNSFWFSRKMVAMSTATSTELRQKGKGNKGKGQHASRAQSQSHTLAWK